jgi:bifunctional non-homologous end joining protein LigD
VNGFSSVRSGVSTSVIGGIRPGKGGRAGAIGSLLLGIPEAGELRYVGRVGSG